MPGGIASGLVALGAASGAIIFAPDALVRGPVVRLGDIANLDAIPASARAKAAALPLIPLSGRSPRTVPIETLSARARSLMPALAPFLPANADKIRIRRRASEPSSFTVSGISPEGVAKGDEVTTRLSVGIFTIERHGVAMAAAVPGERVFVRTADRKAIAARCCGE